MDRELVEKWITALESGEYEQGQRALKIVSEEEGVSYCCLGVLCDIENPDGWDDDNYWTGLEPESPAHDIADVFDLRAGFVQNLITMNDAEGKSFKEIAAFLRKELMI